MQMPFDATDILSCTAGLADTAYDRLTRFFQATNHRPSNQQWIAIRDLMDHLEQAANGQLDPALYLSAIPAGTGKSTSTAMFAQTLMDSPNHGDVGMVIFVNRITEAEDMAKMIGPQYRDRLSVLTSDTAVSALGGHADANDAQVCFATQEALKRTLKATAGASFANASLFHYRGSRRAIVAWDESFAFNRPVVLDADTVAGLAKAMRMQSPEAATTLKRWSLDVDTLTGLCSVPDFEGMGVDFSRLEDDVGGSDELVSVAKALAVISGDEGFITRQGAAAALVTHYPEIPASLMPLVVTDASAKVNPSYAQMARTRAVRWLVDAPKTYRNMAIRLVPTAASRSVYRDLKTTRGRDLLDLSVRYIESVPAGETVLVIGYRGWFKMKGVDETNLEDALRKRLKPEDNKRTAYLAYGRHTATNDYKHVRHVLLMGLNFIPKAASYAASGAALDLNLKNQHPTEDQVKTMQSGLLMDSTLQALLRGNARNGVEGDCGDMEAVIFQTTQTGISVGDYRRMFPEVRVITDTVLIPSKPLKGRLKELEGIVTRRLGAGDREMTNASLCGEMDMSERNFRALVQKPEWQERRAQLGLNPQQLSGRMMGLRLVA
jgi:hypothetical protein